MSTVKSMLVVALLCIVAMAFTVNAATTVSMKFVEDHIVIGSTAIVEFDIKDWNTGNLVLTPKIDPSAATVVPPPHLYTVLDASEASHHAELVLGYEIDGYCWDTTTGQVVANVATSSGAIQISTNDLWDTMVTYATADGATRVYAGVIRCPVAFSAEFVPTALTFAFDNNSTPTVETFISLAFPTKGFVTPLVDFKSASISQVNDDPISTSSISVEFTTDTAGLYTVSLINGPAKSKAENLNDGKWADFWCTSGSDKNAARIQYSGANVDLYVTKPTAKNSIKCTILYSNEKDSKFVTSDRLAVQISIAHVTVTRGLDYKATPAGISASLQGAKNNNLAVELTSTPLTYSSSPINVNSTVVFKFSKHIAVSNIILNNDGKKTSYRDNENCNFYATAFVDSKANTITLKDVDTSSGISSLDCYFEFDGSDVFAYDKSADMGTVAVSIDGQDLVSLQANTKATPIYFSTVGLLGLSEQTITEDNGSYKVVDVFSFVDNYSNTHTNMRNPVLMVQIAGAQLFNIEDYSKQVSCEATSPTSTKFESLKLVFDKKFHYWSVKLDKLVSIDSYSILIKCTRSLPKLTKYGLDTTPSSALSLGVYNLLDGKRFYSPATTQYPFSVKQATATPASTVYPTDKSVQLGSIAANLVTPNIDLAGYNGAVAKFTAETAQAVLAASTANTGFTFKPLYTENNPLYPSSEYIAGKQAEQYFNLATSDSNGLNSLDVQAPSQLHFLNFFPNTWSDVGAYTQQVRQYFTASKDDTSVVTWVDTTTTQYKDAVKAFFTAKFGTDYLLPTVSFTGENFVSGGASISTITGCGVDAGRYVIPPSNQVNYDFKPASGATQSDLDNHWAAFKSFGTSFIPCQLNEKCSYNADCISGLSCKGGVCIHMPTYATPYAEVNTSASKAFDKAYFSSATMTSSIVAVIAVALAIVF